MLTGRGEILKKFLDELVKDPSLFPIYDYNNRLLKTFCNFGARRNYPGENFHEFDAEELLADDMGEIMRLNKSKKWKLMSGDEASKWSMTGARSIAFMSSSELGEDHGHIARIYPKNPSMSGSLKKNVPFVANIGRGDPSKPIVSISPLHKTCPNWVCKSSQAFPVSRGECRYYGYLG